MLCINLNFLYIYLRSEKTGFRLAICMLIVFCRFSQVNLLDGKRSLNVNIFLKQFRMPNEDIVDLLRNGESEKFGAEKLKSLQKILPSQEEVC